MENIDFATLFQGIGTMMALVPPERASEKKNQGTIPATR